ncbi:MAG: hypothetical protein RLZZ629_836 [Actinomycetota bacterium]
MNNFEITDYKYSPYTMELEYVDGEYCYTVLCDFEWSEECTSHYIDFSVTPLSGTFFHETTDEVGSIEITDDYKQWLQDKVKEYRNQTLWFHNEAFEKMQDLETEEFSNWANYGI